MGGNLQLGKVCVLDRKATAKLGVVPLCHIHLRFPLKLPSALRLPDTRSLSFLASPRQTCTVEGKHKFVFNAEGDKATAREDFNRPSVIEPFQPAPFEACKKSAKIA